MKLDTENTDFPGRVAPETTLHINKDKQISAEERARLREQLADQEHERWSGWMKYLFSQCTKDEFGNIMISLIYAERWQRQIGTPYSELSEEEKDSDRKEADNTLRLLDPFLEKQGKQERNAARREDIETINRYAHPIDGAIYRKPLINLIEAKIEDE